MPDARGGVREDVQALEFSREFSRVWCLFLKIEFFMALITEGSSFIFYTAIYSACDFVIFV